MLDEDSKNLSRKGMECFGGIAPTYHIALLDKPTIIWKFNSLLLAIQMMFSFMLTNESSTIKLCKHCNKIFVAYKQASVYNNYRDEQSSGESYR